MLPVESIDEAIEIINSRWVLLPVPGSRSRAYTFWRREHPLAVYVFTKDSKFKEKGMHSPDVHPLLPQHSHIAIVFDNTQSGAAIANEVVLHLAGACPPSATGTPQSDLAHVIGILL